jgi:lysophospholipase L1-like esterase
MSSRARALFLLASLPLASCGGSSSSPTGPGGTPTPPPGSPVSGFLFYDENGNGVADASEVVRFPSVGVTIGGASGATTTGGRFSLPSVPNGTQVGQARAETLPAYFTATTVNVTVPASGDVPLPAKLALGSRSRPNVYLAFGDSITAGEGSSDDQGYVDDLGAQLKSFWGRADMVIDGEPGTRSIAGQARLPGSLSRIHPAYALILYGTNDWNEADCRNNFPCYTIDALRSMIQDTRSAGAFPIVGTIPPVSPAYTDRQATERNDWVRRTNELLRQMAAQERAQVAEVYGDFMKQASLPPLYFDFLHPNDRGYAIMAGSFFRAVTQPLPGGASALDDGGPVFFVRPGPRR